jgi:2-octaprenyl-6-methoxyphenol hydroxylase
VEAREFGAVVLEHLRGLEAVDFICPARVTHLEVDEQSVQLGVEGKGGSSEIVQARLLVGADGAQSTVRGLVGLGETCKEYGQAAVIANVTPEHQHRGRAFERMTSTGPFALLPHVGGRCGLVWCVADGEADALCEMPEAEFLALANERSDGELGRLSRLGRRSAYPLKLILAERDIAPRALLLGNAAHAIHPAGAQGFNLGLRDVAVLAELLHREIHKPGVDKPDPGSESLLNAYSAWRGPDQRATAAWSDGLVGLFASQHGFSSAARSLGLLAHAVLPPLRRRLASQAMGYRGRVPRLALGEPLEPFS